MICAVEMEGLFCDAMLHSGELAGETSTFHFCALWSELLAAFRNCLFGAQLASSQRQTSSPSEGIPPSVITPSPRDWPSRGQRASEA